MVALTLYDATWTIARASTGPKSTVTSAGQPRARFTDSHPNSVSFVMVYVKLCCGFYPRYQLIDVTNHSTILAV